ncbi:MAG TPA: antibiotic biosynthesis monooxygenase [Stellaceae bacterium]|nr:antibiotic biosynthesis monooxygenase [Stellaceae bacterium]
MWTSLRRAFALVLALVSLTGMAYAGGGGDRPSGRGPIFDITHFDVLPVNAGMPDSFLQPAYSALFAYRDASQSDFGSKSFRVVNWLLAPNHSQIIDVWSSLDAFEAHLAQAHSTDFRFAVQLQPPPPPPGFNCCIGSPIDDRQYSLVKSFNTPWTSAGLAPESIVGNENLGVFIITYADFLVDADPGKAAKELIRYGSDTSRATGQLSYTVLQQLDRPNRFATLEVWDSVTDYNNWQTNPTTTKFVAKVMPLLGSPFDHRVNILCGSTYVDNTGCVAP